MATQTATVPANRAVISRTANLGAVPRAPKAADRARTYKDFLTPALHRRFTRSAFLISGACYLESVLIRFPSLFWVWNPISLTGVRALLLLLPCLAIFIVRVSNIHVGKRTTTSSAEAGWEALKSFRTWHTLAWYMWSAWFFGELYIWSRPASAHLTWVDPGEEYERPKLNENPIFLRSFMCCLGIAQAYLHLSRDYDQVPMLKSKQAKATDAPQPQEQSSKLPEALQELVAELPGMAGSVLRLVIPGLILTIPIYFTFIRYLVWPWCYAIGKTLHRDLLPSERPTGVGVDHVFKLVWQSIFSGCLLVFLWESSSAIFTIYVSQPPLKREQPLTSELKDSQGKLVSRSKDPNASLLSGLKSKKEMPRSFAHWELWLICSDFEARRKTIYTEVDRKEGSTWSQISRVCLDEIEGIKGRIKDARFPVQKTKEAEASEKKLMTQQQSVSTEIPKIADRKVLDGEVWQRRRPDFASQVSASAKVLGQSPTSGKPLMSPYARRTMEWGRDRILSKEDQKRLSYKALTQDASGFSVNFLQSPLGEPFRQTFARSVCQVIFAGPTSRKATIIYAAKSLSRLAVCSLKEDDYGQVAKSIPTLMRAFTSTIIEINGFTATLAPHWTDVQFIPRDRQNIKDVREVLGVLRASLQDILLAFGEYAAAIGVTKVDLREAREAVGNAPEMRKV